MEIQTQGTWEHSHLMHISVSPGRPVIQKIVGLPALAPRGSSSWRALFAKVVVLVGDAGKA
eukprot:gene7004-4087_t